ncbi:hypothetical protein B0H16DRAFT_1452890 [Mycena metata]|uniref:Uncharacterized protein n=1 Tax=Mycena metata TaxID=1033252 RepID=A0AAD7JP40_9AGAR|nr:hypothetical protein B0H16DRAFT_1452890 [Mycena metata]
MNSEINGIERRNSPLLLTLFSSPLQSEVIRPTTPIKSGVARRHIASKGEQRFLRWQKGKPSVMQSPIGGSSLVLRKEHSVCNPEEQSLLSPRTARYQRSPLSEVLEDETSRRMKVAVSTLRHQAAGVGLGVGQRVPPEGNPVKSSRQQQSLDTSSQHDGFPERRRSRQGDGLQWSLRGLLALDLWWTVDAAQFFHRGPAMNTGILRRWLGNADAPTVRTPPPTGNEDDAENREGRERKSGGGTACKFRCLSQPLGRRYWCVTVSRGRETISKSARRALPLPPALPPPLSALRAPSRFPRTRVLRGRAASPSHLPSLPPSLRYARVIRYALRTNAAQSSRPMARALHVQGLGTSYKQTLH